MRSYVSFVKQLGLSEDVYTAMMYENARRLPGGQPERQLRRGTTQ